MTAPRSPFWPALAAASLCLSAGEEPAHGLQQMSLEELLKVKLTVASRTETTLDEAPSVVSVITAEDIQRMGARDLRDVIRTVPGFELGVRMIGYPEFGLRGIISDSTEKIRILLDGLAVNENLEGSGTIIFGDFALDNVERIEIIRGPGSALYGTNAFVGVISIITKAPPAAGASTTVTGKVGTFATREGSVLVGRSGSQARFSAFLHYLDSTGAQSPVAHDALQTVPGSPYDSGLNSGISLAGTPDGHTDEFRKKLTAQIKFDLGEFYFHGIFVDARKGPYLGAYWAVNRNSEAHPSQIMGEAGWTLHPTETLALQPKLYLLRYHANNLWNTAPDGYRVPGAQGGTVDYTQGQYVRNIATQDVQGTELKATWTPGARHTVLAGASAERERLYGMEDTANLPGSSSDTMVPAPPIMTKAPHRDLSSAYLQEQWSIAAGLGLTAGMRMDRYSDNGTRTTPRLALVWRASPAWNFKAMYGEAFRAPTFVESYLHSVDGLESGNRGNRPETIRTGELEASYRFRSRALVRLVLFQNRINDLIRLMPSPGGALQYRNDPDVTLVKGFEAELNLTFAALLRGYLNVSGQSGRNRTTGEVLTGTANWRGNAGLDWTATDRLGLNGSLNVVGPRQRAAGDARPALEGYQVVNLAVRYTLLEGLDLTLTAHNLMNSEQKFPEPFGYVPGDFPWEGRAMEAGVRWTF
ncbi:MAG: TonB-dependent receptor [Holophaga sp.]|nr:TonB-dependent receptor [Holophaga sp.]